MSLPVGQSAGRNRFLTRIYLFFKRRNCSLSFCVSEAYASYINEDNLVGQPTHETSLSAKPVKPDVEKQQSY